MSESDDDKPLALRSAAVNAIKHEDATPDPAAGDASSEDDQPLAARAPAIQQRADRNRVKADPSPAKKANNNLTANGNGRDESEEDDDDDDDDFEGEDSDEDRPLSQRVQKSTPVKKPPPTRQRQNDSNNKRTRATTANSSPSKRPRSSKKDDEKPVKWTKLTHNGVLFPPEYEPHGVKMKYKGKDVNLTAEQEEVATMFAMMLDNETYMSKETFKKNFWDGFKAVLGKGHVIRDLEGCDFRPIHEWHLAEREKKKQMSKEEKQKLKEEKDAKEAAYKYAMVDGHREDVGNFRVEPPGLFRGRGEHPKMGMIKRRIYPRDITINMSKGAAVPEHPYRGQTWKELRHDQTVTWLAFWQDPVNSKEYKYVWLAANSRFKGESDLAKYEKARALKDRIDGIRRKYESDMRSDDARTRQMATALYFIDKLALRAGHEKDEDEAPTVGCCTLKVDHVECIPPRTIKFDFLGKDSIQYENSVEVDVQVFKNVQHFKQKDRHGKKKDSTADLFDAFGAPDLNQELKNLMDGLTVKVFRTYNASITLDRLLHERDIDREADPVAKKAFYDAANKEVAILCNHQRSVPKGHEASMDKLQEKITNAQKDLADLQSQLRKAKSDDRLQARVAKKKEQIKKLDIQQAARESLKTVALGTSKINYMDPRITVAWCKLHEMPIEKIFNKSLLSKFHWCMDVDPDFRF